MVTNFIYDKSVKRDSKHICGKKFCPTCFQIRDIRHNRYMPINCRKPVPKDDNPLYIFYDLECTQEDCLPGSCKFVHRPNLCIVHKVCNNCKDKPKTENIYSNCRVRERVIEFSENSCIVTEFLVFITSLHPKFNRIAIITYNMEGYDGHFL